MFECVRRCESIVCVVWGRLPSTACALPSIAYRVLYCDVMWQASTYRGRAVTLNPGCLFYFLLHDFWLCPYIYKCFIAALLLLFLPVALGFVVIHTSASSHVLRTILPRWSTYVRQSQGHSFKPRHVLF